MPETDDSLQISVRRGGPDDGHFERFRVPAYPSQTVLDVVSWIQQNADPTLSYRFACRVGMCGSCAMMVNGVPRWTCRTHVSKVLQDGKLRIEPLRNLPVIKDLAADMDPFFDKWVKAGGQHVPTQDRTDQIPAIDSQSAPRQEADAGIECINCAVCYAACDTVTGNPDYLGPAPLLRAWTVFNDAKAGNKKDVLDAVSGTDGCLNCHTLGSCTQYCPNGLDPMRAIAGLKRATSRHWWSR